MNIERALIAALTAFCLAVGVFALVGVLLATIEFAAKVAGAVGAAGLGGVTVAVGRRKR